MDCPSGQCYYNCVICTGWAQDVHCPPNAPTGLSATANALGQQTKISLAWTNKSINVSQIQVWREPTTTGPWSQIYSTTNPNTTTYNDTTVAAGTPYWYKVVAYNQTAAPASNVATATTPIGAPTGLTAAANAFNTPTQVSLHWTNSINSGTHNQVFRTKVIDGTGYNWDIGAAQAFTDTSAAQGTCYSYQVESCQPQYQGGTVCSTSSNAATACTLITVPVLMSVIQPLLQ
jgi:fibronectin type 3 domain-containing protein